MKTKYLRTNNDGTLGRTTFETADALNAVLSGKIDSWTKGKTKVIVLSLDAACALANLAADYARTLAPIVWTDEQVERAWGQLKAAMFCTVPLSIERHTDELVAMRAALDAAVSDD